jgi:hypothetical protein
VAVAENHAAAGSIPTLQALNVLAAVLAARAEVLVAHPAMTAKDSMSQASHVGAAPARALAAARGEGKHYFNNA